MMTLDELYLHYDGTIPDDLRALAKAGDINTYARQIARAAERQFERIAHETHRQIRYYRGVSVPVFSTTTLTHLSKQLCHHRHRAMEARDIATKSTV